MDDLGMLSERRGSLKEMMSCLQKESDKAGLKINTDKTKIMADVPIPEDHTYRRHRRSTNSPFRPAHINLGSTNKRS